VARLTLAVSLLLLPASVFAQSAEVPVPLEPPEVGVPFGCGMSFPISQVHNVGSHVNNDGWAWDFRMPEGTPVVAALDGVVRLARGDSKDGGCDPQFAREANYVVVEHDGGLETQYLHFSSVVVRPGDYVRQGQLLGYSGKTGWACGAHLHFKVAIPLGDGWNNPSVEARIRGYGDPGLETWISSPACGANAPVVADKSSPRARPADEAARSPTQAAGGTVAPASLPDALDATGSGHPPGLTVAPAGHLGAETSRPVPAQAVRGESRAAPVPALHPLSSGAASLTVGTPNTAPNSAPLAPAQPAPSGTPTLLHVAPRGLQGAAGAPTSIRLEREPDPQPAATERGTPAR
jgi:murein DD-endopeptidase MepM/ murein hydrolase activator NlpD